MAANLVLLETEDRVATIRFNRPEKNNAIDFPVLDVLEEVVDEVAKMDNLAAVVVTGAGDRAFCGGVDDYVVLQLPKEDFGGMMRRLWQVCWRLAHLQPPVIAAINGYCYAGGVIVAFASDLRVAVDSATFTIPGSQYGLAVGNFQLPYLVGATWAKEFLLLAEPLDAPALYRMGLLNRVVPAHEFQSTVDRMVNRLRQLAPSGLYNNKRLLNLAVEMGPAAIMEAELANDALYINSGEIRDRIAAVVAARRERTAARKQQP